MYGGCATGLGEPSEPLACTNSHNFPANAKHELYGNHDEFGKTTKYEYTLTGQLATVTDPLRQTTTYQYDALNQLIEIKQDSDVSALDGDLEKVNQMNITRYERDLLGKEVVYGLMAQYITCNYTILAKSQLQYKVTFNHYSNSK